mmetsp:Transcript_15659/g.59562  ORF Transcript_15659/g.59562 Transcript_15659/m.59562 type:complete len:465 (+) Transcript_15659:446-1840(+)
MSCTAQAVEDALQHVLFHIQGLLDLSEGHQVPGVEELDTHSLERRDLKVVRLRSGCAGIGRPHRRIPQRMLPLQSSVIRRIVVVLLEYAHTSCHLRRQGDVHGRVRWPVPGGKHLDAKLELRFYAFILQVDIKLRSLVVANGQVIEHSFHLPGELSSAGKLELADHHPFPVVGGRALIEKPLGQLVSVDVPEQILLREVSKEPHQLGQAFFYLLIGHLLAARLQDAIAVGAQKRRRLVLPDVAVHHFDKRVLHGLLEQAMAAELLLHQLRVLVVEVEERLDEDMILAGVLVALFDASPACAYNFHALVLNVLPYELRHGVQAIGDLSEEREHSTEVLQSIICQERTAAAALFFEELLARRLQELRLHHSEQAVFGTIVEILGHPLGLRTQRLLRPDQVRRRRLRVEPFGRFHPVVAGGALQELLLEVPRVHIQGRHSNVLQEADAIAHSLLIDDAALALLVDLG